MNKILISVETYYILYSVFFYIENIFNIYLYITYAQIYLVNDLLFDYVNINVIGILFEKYNRYSKLKIMYLKLIILLCI